MLENIVNCRCGNAIDIAGITPQRTMVKVYCTVCGTVTEHQRR